MRTGLYAPPAAAEWGRISLPAWGLAITWLPPWVTHFPSRTAIGGQVGAGSLAGRGCF